MTEEAISSFVQALLLQSDIQIVSRFTKVPIQKENGFKNSALGPWESKVEKPFAEVNSVDVAEYLVRCTEGWNKSISIYSSSKETII